MCFALVSVNVHCRKYFSKLEPARERASREILKWNSKYETAIYDQEIIGVLMFFKTALDCLSQALVAMYGCNLKTWGDNGNKSSAERLISFIEKHQDDTRDCIDLRDNLGHGLTEYKNTIGG